MRIRGGTYRRLIDASVAKIAVGVLVESRRRQVNGIAAAAVAARAP